MASVDEIWGWIYEPVQELKRDYTTAPDTPWNTLRESFLTKLGLSTADQNPMIEELLRKLDDMSDSDRNDIIGGDRLDDLAYEYAQRHGVAAVADPAPAVAQEQVQQTTSTEESYDPQKWQEFLEENGPVWDGTDAAWSQFKEWFLYYAREGGFEAPATSLLDYLSSQDGAGRIATLETYRVIIRPVSAAPSEPSAQAEPEVTATDMDGLMAELLEENPEFRDIPEDRRKEIITELLREAQTAAE